MSHEAETWKRSYTEDGFLIVHDLIDSSTLSRLQEGMNEITQNLRKLPRDLRNKIVFEREHVRKYPEWYRNVITPKACGDSVREISDLPLFNSVFGELICHPRALDVLETIFDSTEFSLTMVAGKPKAARVGNGVINGKFHRDSPFDCEVFTGVNTVMSFLCLDDMTPENGSTAFVRGSHRIPIEEAIKPEWKEVEIDRISSANITSVKCPAGGGVFFTSKVLHAAGHNRSDHSRRTIYCGWVGPGVLPAFPARFAYQGVKPRSQDPVFQKQIRMAFPRLFASSPAAV